MIKHLKTLLRGEVDARCLEKPNVRWFIAYCIAIVLGSSVYGATIGLWRAPLQSVFTAIKFPLLIFLTCIGNGAVNGMLAQVLGSGLSFRQTAFAILMSFAVASLILGGFSPITLFILYNAPPLDVAHACLRHCLCWHRGESASPGVASKNEWARGDGARGFIQLARWESISGGAARLEFAPLYRLTPTRRPVPA
ncbi:MAG: hypothetical protein DME45_13590 [Verrucomicrobia bacterium]|nr:MAG: hypothetical protein DME45_13590 [Verrucomicrobiota bacterium]